MKSNPLERPIPPHDLDAIDHYTDSETGDVKPISERPAPAAKKAEAAAIQPKEKVECCC